jgi:hypothetical protein
MGLIENLRKKFEKENADEFIIKINIEMNGNAKKLYEVLKQKETKKGVRKKC